ncbi:MAG TPA: carboxypeptidase regulatory-like domain-containing protein, partial [Isosphaeraceae bacterium]
MALWALRPGTRAAWRRLDWVVPGPEAPVRLVLGAAAGTTVRVLGPDGQPVAAARLRVASLAHLGVPGELAGRLAARTGRDGTASLPACTAGEIAAVRIEASGLGTQRGGPSPPDDQGIRTVTLEPVGRVSGRVVDPDGRPVAGLAIGAMTYPEGLDLGGMLGEAEDLSDAQGRFEILALAAGRLVLALKFRPGAPPAYRGLPPANRVVEAGRTTHVEIALKPAVLARGQVHERGTGVPIPGVRAVLNPARGGDAASESDAEGRFAGFMLGDQAVAFLYGTPRPYVIPADAPETNHLLAPGTTAFTLPPIELTRGAAVQGVVVDDAGRPAAGALVRATWEPPGGLLQSLVAQADAKGDFRLEGVDPLAALRLTASSRGASTGAAVPARADAGRPVTLRISPTQTTPLAGRVVDVAGRPIVGASVRVSWSRTRNARGRAWRLDPVRIDGGEDLVTDAEGRFRTPFGLSRDVEYQAQVRADGRLPNRTEWIRPGEGREATFPDVVLRRLRKVTGRVVDRRGRPVGGVTVLQAGDGPMRTHAVADDRGLFRIRGLIEGRAFLFARKDGFRFHGQPIDTEAGAVEMVLTRAGEPPAATSRTIPSALPEEEEIALARRVLGPYAERVAVAGDDGRKYRVLSRFALADPGRVLELAETTRFSTPFFNDLLRAAVVGGLARESPEEAASVAETIQDPATRVWAYTELADRVPAADRDRRAALLDRARLQTKAITDPGGRLRGIGRVADRWLDLGASDRATALLREGQAIAREVPGTDYDRVTLAQALARVDLPAALDLIDRVRADARRTDQIDRYYIFDRGYGEIAYRLAAPAPAEAERVLGLIRDPFRRDGYTAAACPRIAPRDPWRAERLAA